MTAKHRDPVYLRNARIIRDRVRRAHRTGGDVTCWRCGMPIDPEQRFDVGHRRADGGPSLDNLAPEHRYKTARCIGNRADGGRLGAQRQAATRTARTTSTTTTNGILPW